MLNRRHAILGGMALSAAPRAASAIEAEQAPSPAFSPVTTVVELFTSQGCSSCPPADALMHTYAGRPDVLALSLPVDYWDYLGWKDTLGSPKHSERQRAYAKQRGDGQVYTPQAVINGVRHINGAAAAELNAALEDSKAQPPSARLPLKFWTDRGSLMIETGPVPEGMTPKESVIWLAIIQNSVEVPITRGENTGKTLTYTNVVRELTSVGTWTGDPVRIQLARTALMRPHLESVAVLIQHGRAGPIVAAAKSGLW